MTDLRAPGIWGVQKMAAEAEAAIADRDQQIDAFGARVAFLCGFVGWITALCCPTSGADNLELAVLESAKLLTNGLFAFSEDELRRLRIGIKQGLNDQGDA